MYTMCLGMFGSYVRMCVTYVMNVCCVLFLRMICTYWYVYVLVFMYVCRYVACVCMLRLRACML